MIAVFKEKDMANTKKISTKPTQKTTTAKTAAREKSTGTLSDQLQNHFGFDGFKGPQQEIIETLFVLSASGYDLRWGGHHCITAHCTNEKPGRSGKKLQQQG
jgi:hypothetical protein